jgi:hypothetical protein
MALYRIPIILTAFFQVILSIRSQIFQQPFRRGI